jgi:hypothetical protein
MLASKNNFYNLVSIFFRIGSRIIVFAIALTLIAGCSEDYPLHPSFEELTQKGFYVYVLPTSEVEQRGWLQSISIWSWDRHCKGIEISETFNPIRVSYSGQESELYLTLLIGPWSMYWDHNEPTKEVRLDTPWSMDGTAMYYTNDGHIHLKFKDQFGIPVQVTSCSSITEVVQWINQLEYVGPLAETVTNPWDTSRCNRH